MFSWGLWAQNWVIIWFLTCYCGTVAEVSQPAERNSWSDLDAVLRRADSLQQRRRRRFINNVSTNHINKSAAGKFSVRSCRLRLCIVSNAVSATVCPVTNDTSCTHAFALAIISLLRVGPPSFICHNSFFFCKFCILTIMGLLYVYWIHMCRPSAVSAAFE